MIESKLQKCAMLLGLSLFTLPLAFGILHAISIPFQYSSPASLCSSLFLGLLYTMFFSLLLIYSCVDKPIIPDWKVWLAKFLFFCSCFAVIPSFAISDVLTEYFGPPEVIRVTVVNKNDGRWRKGDCQFSITVGPIESYQTKICIDSDTWARWSVGNELDLHGSRSFLGFAITGESEPYPPTPFAEIDNIPAVPFIKANNVDAYANFLKTPSPRAAVIAENGDFFYATGILSVKIALKACRDKLADGCHLYAINETVVFPEGRLHRSGDAK